MPFFGHPSEPSVQVAGLHAATTTCSGDTRRRDAVSAMAAATVPRVRRSSGGAPGPGDGSSGGGPPGVGPPDAGPPAVGPPDAGPPVVGPPAVGPGPAGPGVSLGS